MNLLHVFANKSGLLFSPQREHEVAPGKYLGYTHDIFSWPKKLNTGRLLVLDEPTSFLNRYDKLPKVSKPKRKKPATKFASVPSGVVTAYCCYCETKLVRHQITREHIVPKSKGGRANNHNIKPCCRYCNTDRANESLSVILAKINEGSHRFNLRRPDEQEVIKKNIIRWIEYTEAHIYTLVKRGAYYKP